MPAYITVMGKLLDERDDAIRMLVFPNWDIWLPRSSLNPKGGLRIKRATREVGADVAQWKINELIRDQQLPLSVRGPVAPEITGALVDELEATDDHFTRKGQFKS